eukprot:2194791-Rhodomonas_salina.1
MTPSPTDSQVQNASVLLGGCQYCLVYQLVVTHQYPTTPRDSDRGLFCTAWPVYLYWLISTGRI